MIEKCHIRLCRTEVVVKVAEHSQITVFMVEKDVRLSTGIYGAANYL